MFVSVSVSVSVSVEFVCVCVSACRCGYRFFCSVDESGSIRMKDVDLISDRAIKWHGFNLSEHIILCEKVCLGSSSSSCLSDILCHNHNTS